MPIFSLTGSEQLNSIELRLISLTRKSEALEKELLAWQSSFERSEKHASELQTELAMLRIELSGLRIELFGLRQELENSAGRSEKAEQQATELSSLLVKSEEKVASLSESFESTVKPFRLAAETAKRRSRISGLVAKLGIPAAFVLGVVLGALAFR